MSSPSQQEEQFLNASHDVIATDHTIAIRYHRFQDDHRDEPLDPGAHCYIILNDKRHLPYLVSAIITKVDKIKQKYEIKRINDNQIELYHFHEIVIAYDKNIHSINIEKHNQSIQLLRNNSNTNINTKPKIIKKIKKPVKKQNKRKRKRENESESESIKDENNSNSNPNKKRKLNDMNTNNINTLINNKNKPYQNVLTIAQPYFPIPHPYFRQNAIIKWKPSDESNTEYEVGRIIDFDMESDIIYIQNTYRCGTKDDEQADLIKCNWNEFKLKTNASFIDHSYLYQLKQPVLYWWDRPGCGCVCSDTIESLDYGSHDDLLYGITGGTKKTNYKDHQLKWVHKDGLFKSNDKNKLIMGKYIARSMRGSYKSSSKSTHNNIINNKKYDCIIIGGGISGLTVNWALNKINKGYKIKLLEAQNYIGGRLKQHTFPKKCVYDPINKKIYKLPKVNVELGAAFLSGSAKDNRFWNWLQKTDKHICADWGGYNNGWWNGQSFIDSDLGEFVNDSIIERIKNICDDIQILCCKLLMPLSDISVIDGLEYLKHKIPKQQLFAKEENKLVQKYFYDIYNKYKILSANWVGPQGLWQQQQTVELQNLDFEALYKFLCKIFDINNKKTNKKSKKWLNAIEKLIMDYYGDKTNIKTLNYDKLNNYSNQATSLSMAPSDTLVNNTPFTNGYNINDDDYNPNENENENENDNDEIDSEATESETHSQTLSPLFQTKPNNNLNNIHRGEFKLSETISNWDEDIIQYDISDYSDFDYQYIFGFRDLLVRDIIHPINESEALDFEKSSGLNAIDYKRFRLALEHLSDCNLFSYHLYHLRCNQKYNKNKKVVKLLNKFESDLKLFDNAIDDFKKILNGKTIITNLEIKKNVYHTNRKTSKFEFSPRLSTIKSANIISRNIINDIVNGITVKNQPEMMDLNAEIVLKDEINNNINNINNIDNNMKPVKEENESKMMDMDMDVDMDENNNNINKCERKKRKHKKHKNKNRKSKKDNNDLFISDSERIDIEIEEKFKQEQFNNLLSLNSNAEQVGDGFVTNGYSQILQPFTTDINIKNNKNVNINHQVTSIEQIPGSKFGEYLNEVRGIDLLTGKPFTFWSNFVCVSVPLGILKLSLNEFNKSDCNGGNSGIKFKPTLSLEKQEAINKMGMGCENKVYLRFTKSFWPLNKPYFQSIQHPEYRFINLSYKQFKLPNNTNVLCTMIPPTMGKKWYSNNPAQELRIVWDVLRVLNCMFKVRKNNNNNIKCNGNVNVNDIIMNDNKMDELKQDKNGHTNNNNNINENVNDVIMHQYNNDKMESDLSDSQISYDDNNISEQKQRECELLNNNRDEISELLEMLVDYKVTDWEHNVFTRGSYSYLPKGAIYTHCKSFQKYDGNGVYFCGEATSIEGFECVDGAHETGFNVAKEIHKQLQKNKLKYNK